MCLWWRVALCNRVHLCGKGEHFVLVAYVLLAAYVLSTLDVSGATVLETRRRENAVARVLALDCHLRVRILLPERRLEHRPSFLLHGRSGHFSRSVLLIIIYGLTFKKNKN